MSRELMKVREILRRKARIRILHGSRHIVFNFNIENLKNTLKDLEYLLDKKTLNKLIYGDK